MGGAFAALGGDASSLAFNPAGIGVYRSSEFTITGNLMQVGTNASYMGNSYDESKTKFGLSNLGIIGTYNTYNDNGLVNLNFGFTYDKLANFNERYEYMGNPIAANNGTYLDYFASLANEDLKYGGLGAESYAADYTGLIAFDSIHGYYPNLNGGNSTQNGRASYSSGNIGEYGFNFGGNVSNILYFGLRVGLQSVSYKQTIVDEEWSVNRDTLGLDNFYYERNYRISGIGVNFKAGVIVWPFVKSDIPLTGLRLGAAIHTPTYLSIDDKYDFTLESALFGNNTNYFVDYKDDLEYSLETPLKLLGGVAYVFGHQDSNWRGILSFDYEHLDYSKIKARRDGAGVGQNSNKKMKEYFTSTSNFRFGGEIGYQNISLRAGYALYGNPYRISDMDGKVSVYSGGIGIKISDMFNLAFAYQRTVQKDKGYLYSSDGYASSNPIVSQPVNYKIAQNNFFLTLGWRF
jgi:hypothetical protein